MTDAHDPVPMGPAFYKVPPSRMIDARRGIPRRPIFWTEDQVAAMLAMSVERLRTSYLWRVGHDTGIYRNSYLRGVKLPTRTSAPGARDGYRIAEGELIRWLRFHDLWIYDPEAASTDLPPLAGPGEPNLLIQPDIDIERTEPLDPNDEQPDPELLDL